MAIEQTKDGFRFSSGREMYAHAHVIGISPALELSYGYDGGIDWPIEEWMSQEDALSVSDMRELADMMIERWASFRDTLGG